MKKALVLIKNYSPTPSSVANCMQPLLDELSRNFEIDIITDRKRIDVAKTESKDSINIYRIDDYRIMNRQHSKDLIDIKSPIVLKFFTKIVAYFVNVLYYIHYSFFSLERISGGWEKKRVLDKIIELDKVKNYDLVVSVSLPFQSHIISEMFVDYKQNSIKWIAFEFDPFALNKQINISRIRRNEAKKVEIRILNKCDLVILTPELYEFYKSLNFIDMKSNVKKLPYANIEKFVLKEHDISKNFLVDGKINCFFSGRLYKDIRNPDFMIKVFSEIDNICQLVLMTDYSVKELTKNSKNSPKVVPLQNRETALFNMINAEILVNVGNTVEHQVPAKIFEYMSTGKPIIHFSKIKNDPILKYLEHYPKKLIINESCSSDLTITKMIEDFCTENKNYVVDSDLLIKVLENNSSEHVKLMFRGYLTEIYND